MALAIAEVAAAECVSEEALVHLKSYKYSSVDKSLISNYILKHYVRLWKFWRQGIMLSNRVTVERICEIAAVMARAEHGDAAGLLLHFDKCNMFGDIHARSCWTGQ